MRCAAAVVLAALLAAVAGGCGTNDDGTDSVTGDPIAGPMPATPGAPAPGMPGGDPTGMPADPTMPPDTSMAGGVAPPPPDDTLPVDPGGVDGNGFYPDIRGTGPCVGLDTGYPGDDACIPPPEPGEGIQIHIGPPDYKNPGEYEFPVGMEHSLCKDFVSPNTEEVFFQSSLLSARSGTHHIINSCFASPPVNPAGGFGACRAPGGVGDTPGAFALPGAPRPYVWRQPVAPENAGLGERLPASSQCQADMHYFNFSSAPVLKEFWLNLYTIPADQVTEEAEQIRGMGGFGWNITPGTDRVYKYECPVGVPTGPNPRIISLLGHYHAHGVRFTGWLNEMKVFEMFDYNDPQIFYYNSVTKNPEFGPMTAGATSGVLPLKQGDIVKWECHIINASSSTLTYTNEVKTGEMCNFWGASVDVPKIDCTIPTFF
jgi:hypothetical protein